MKILITIALTAFAVGVSIVSIKCYLAFFLKHRVDSSSSILQVSAFLLVLSACFLFGVCFPLGILVALNDRLQYPDVYLRASEVVWLVASFACAMTRLFRGFVRKE